MLRILVTGGAGYIGSVLIPKLIKLDKAQVVVYDNLLFRQTSLASLCYKKNLTFVHGDVRDTDKLLTYVKKADVIIPLAAIVGAPACDRDKKLASEVIVDQIKSITDTITSDQIIIFPNTNSGYGVNENGICTEDSPLNPVSHYGIEKVKAEQFILKTERGISLRLATVFGVSPRMRIDLLVNDFTYRAVRDGYIVLFEKDFKRNYIHVRDIANAFIFMIKQQLDYRVSTGVYNVGLSSANLSKWELCQKIKHYVPKFSIQVDEFTKDPDQRNYIVSNEKIEKLGWRAKYDLDTGIQELIKAYTILLHSDRKYTNL